MKSVKSVYMFTDLEGVAGIDNWDVRKADYANEAKGVSERSEMQRLLTGEVNAAAEGLLAAGVTDIVINDAHGAGRTILPEELIPGVRLVRGANRPQWLVGLSKRFDALVMVGMHAMAGTPNGCLAHTMTPREKYRMNDREVGEMQMAAYLAGQAGIPWIFTSGDLYACRESYAWVPGIVTAAVKEGLSMNCAIHLAPVDARDLIRDRIQDAVAAASGLAPLTVDGPVVLERWREESKDDDLAYGAERVDDQTVRWSGASFWQVFHQAFYGKPDLPLPE